jgi:hypothetical protein
VKTTSPFPPVKEQFCLNCLYLRGCRCRRNPPVIRDETFGTHGIWPRVNGSDWCGEWVAVEEGL